MKTIQLQCKIKQVLMVISFLALLPFIGQAQVIADLEVQKIPSSTFANPGTEIEVISRITNLGTATLRDVTVEDVWPEGFMVNGVLVDKQTWGIETLAAGETQSQTYTVGIPEDAAPSRYNFATKATVVNPQITRNLEYGFEVREVSVLATGIDSIPAAGGIRKVDIIGLIIVTQLLIAAIAAFNISRTYRYES
jgi:uncharacterized repeat protein (TIGR01451 family)